MKACFVLLADDAVQNFARRVVYELNRHFDVPFVAALLPSHVSLKQPFTFESMDVLESYFDALAARVPPFEVTLERFYYSEWSGSAILGLEVAETPALRAVHNLLNRDLPGLVKDARAPFDGPEYRFHLTIEMSKITARNGLKEYFDSLPDPTVRLAFPARQLGMFYDSELGSSAGTYITYRVAPLKG